MEEREFSVFYVDDGRVTAALSVGRSDDLDHARRFTRRTGHKVDRGGTRLTSSATSRELR